MISRRSLILGVSVSVAAPAIIRVAPIMPIRVPKLVAITINDVLASPSYAQFAQEMLHKMTTAYGIPYEQLLEQGWYRP